MTRQKLKRITLSSPSELDTWLTKHSGKPDRVMIVTNTARSPDTLTRDILRAVLTRHGWHHTVSYTLSKTMVGHVVHV